MHPTAKPAHEYDGGKKNVHVHVRVHGWVWASVHICAWCVCCVCGTVCGNVSACFTGGFFFVCVSTVCFYISYCMRKKKTRS